MNPQLPFSFRGILTALTLALSLAAAPANEAFDRANADYEAGRYQQAVDGYTALLEKEGPRAAVLQNLGSAWYRLGDLGRAILNFERAQLLDPNHAALKANLKLARDAA
ncbi:MAG: tetratricopeptide repeat protein, partial [Verrucomicrobiales bacterium]|nr:tetratricopeptide repeat protein [Verrucomicrobiales bacterium]